MAVATIGGVAPGLDPGIGSKRYAVSELGVRDPDISDGPVATRRSGNLRELATEPRMNSASIFDLSPSEKL